MRDVLTVHEPLLVNTLGNTAGTLVFGIFLVLLLRDRAGAKLRGSRLTLAAAALAFLWNLSSLLVIAWGDPRSVASEALVAISSSALSLLPALLLHLSLGTRFAGVRWAGYALSAAAVGIHASEIALSAPEHHTLALRLTTYGFSALTLGAVLALLAGPGDRRLMSRLAGTMSLFLFSLSFVHFGSPEPQSWPIELLAHHAGIALSLFVLLQDYRFLLVDAFVRFLANILLAAGFVWFAVSVADVRQLLAWANGNAFREGMLLAGGCLSLLLFAFLRGRTDQFLGRAFFPRRNLDLLFEELRGEAASAGDEKAFLEASAGRIARCFDADVVGVEDGRAPLPACPVSDLPAGERVRLEALGAEAVVPVRTTADEARWILLGRRRGGRRYLSEDLSALLRVQVEMAERLEQLREAEMRRLVSQAELRALQSQIHPHFLFNALNTLYGVIPREAAGARRTVLNLADIFRYFLETSRSYIPLEEELRIVRAYLEIETLRLGTKLRTEIDVAPEALRLMIPILTVEPLVENAVKHGVASKVEGGTVRIEARVEDGALRVRVTDTGSGFAERSEGGTGVGLENVARRLKLCYGPGAGLRIETSPAGASVEFTAPARAPEAALR